MDQQRKSVILSQSVIADNLYKLELEKQFSFTAGQVIGISLSPDDPPRLYSIASAENDPVLEVVYTEQKDGFLTPRLKDKKPGDWLYLHEPSGFFTGVREPAVWIAGGTGVAPFVSMIRSGYGENKTLIHGAITSGHLYFYDQFRSILGERYIPCCSRENLQPESGIFSGRVTDYIGQKDDLDPDVPYYLCGSSRFVVDTRDLLIRKGVRFGMIFAEIYF